MPYDFEALLTGETGFPPITASALYTALRLLMNRVNTPPAQRIGGCHEYYRVQAYWDGNRFNHDVLYTKEGA